MSRPVVKVTLESTTGAGEPPASDAIARRIGALQLEVERVTEIAPLVLLVELHAGVDAQRLAERLATWPGVAFAQRMLRDEVAAS